MQAFIPESIYQWFVASLCCVCAGCSPAPRESVLSGHTMGTLYVIKVVQREAAIEDAQLRLAIEQVLARIDLALSTYRVDSEISRFNSARSTHWIAASSDLVKVVSAAQQVSELSGGALDITVAPWVNLWGFGPAGTRSDVPPPAQIEQLRAQVGYRKLEVRRHPPALRKHQPELSIDLNSVAPGYAVDILAGRLAAMDVADFMIDIGGEVRVRGRSARGDQWRVAIEKPLEQERQVFEIVVLDDLAVTTSGEYRHYDLRAGRRYSHTIDPRTARPIEHDLAAVSVISDTGLQADAWATALNVLGFDAGYELARQQSLAAMFMRWQDGKLVQRTTPEFARHLLEK